MNNKTPVSSRTLIAFIVAATAIVACGALLFAGVGIGAIVTLFTALIGYRQGKIDKAGENE